MVAMEMAPAMSCDLAARKLRGTMRQLAMDTQCGVVAGQRVNQVRRQGNGMAVGVVAVPAGRAMAWLERSGRQGLHVQPYLL